MLIYLTIPLNNKKVLTASSLLNAKATGVMLDLEDGVSFDKKPLAKTLLVDAVNVYLEKFSHVIVRPNADMKSFNEELDLLVSAGLQDKVSIIISKPEMTEDSYNQLSFLRSNFKTQKGHVLAVETPASLYYADQFFLEFKDVIKTAFFGTEDFSLEMGIENTIENIRPYAEKFLLACKANKIKACGQPGRFLDFGNKEAYSHLCKTASAMGFDGGIAVNALGIEPIFAAYSIPDMKKEEYLQILSASDSAPNSMFTLNKKVYGPPEIKKIRNAFSKSKLEFV